MKMIFSWQIINKGYKSALYFSIFIAIDSDICTPNQAPNLCMAGVQRRKQKEPFKYAPDKNNG